MMIEKVLLVSVFLCCFFVCVFLLGHGMGRIF